MDQQTHDSMFYLASAGGHRIHVDHVSPGDFNVKVEEYAKTQSVPSQLPTSGPCLSEYFREAFAPIDAVGRRQVRQLGTWGNVEGWLCGLGEVEQVSHMLVMKINMEVDYWWDGFVSKTEVRRKKPIISKYLAMEPTEPWTDVDQLFLVLYQQAFQQRVNWWAVTSSDYSRWAFGVLSEDLKKMTIATQLSPYLCQGSLRYWYHRAEERNYPSGANLNVAARKKASGSPSDSDSDADEFITPYTPDDPPETPARVQRLIDEASYGTGYNTRGSTYRRGVRVMYNERSGEPGYMRLAKEHLRDMREKSIFLSPNRKPSVRKRTKKEEAELQRLMKECPDAFFGGDQSGSGSGNSSSFSAGSGLSAPGLSHEPSLVSNTTSDESHGEFWAHKWREGRIFAAAYNATPLKQMANVGEELLRLGVRDPEPEDGQEHQEVVVDALHVQQTSITKVSHWQKHHFGDEYEIDYSDQFADEFKKEQMDYF